MRTPAAQRLTLRGDGSISASMIRTAAIAARRRRIPAAGLSCVSI
jgi:hypothetical protein